MADSEPALTKLLRQWQSGNDEALNIVTEQLYSQLRKLASAQLAGERKDHTLRPTALLHEAYLRMQGASAMEISDRNHFISIAARVMRRVLVDHARSRARLKRDSGQKVTLHDLPGHFGSNVGVLEIDLALEKLEQMDARKARALELISFAGATYAEAAAILEISEATLNRDLKMARAFLKMELRQQ